MGIASARRLRGGLEPPVERESVSIFTQLTGLNLCAVSGVVPPARQGSTTRGLPASEGSSCYFSRGYAENRSR